MGRPRKGFALAVPSPEALAFRDSVDASDVMKVSEAAAFLKVTRRVLLTAVGNGQIPALKLGARFRFSKKVLSAYLSGLT